MKLNHGAVRYMLFGTYRQATLHTEIQVHFTNFTVHYMMLNVELWKTAHTEIKAKRVSYLEIK